VLTIAKNGDFQHHVLITFAELLPARELLLY